VQLFALGLNHQSAPLAIRERIAFGSETLTAALAQLVRARPARESAILSTCNRTEIYCAAGEPPEALAWLAEFHQLDAVDLKPYLYTLPEADAVRHAFRVAAGLDSMVLGEPQILGQMKEAVRIAREAGTLGTTLNKLFQNCFAVAKDVRTNTEIGSCSISMAAAAVKLAARIFPALNEQRLLLIGAGEMIELAASFTAGAAGGASKIPPLASESHQNWAASAPREEARTTGPVTGCRNTPHRGCRMTGGAGLSR